MIEIVPHNPDWAAAFEREARILQGAMPQAILKIHHIGSTAIPDIWAKPVIDIMCAVTSLNEVDSVSARMNAIGYVGKGEHRIAGRRYFQKRNQAGEHTHHVHMYETGSEHLERHLALRNYLLANPSRAQDYSDRKLAILRGRVPSRSEYQNQKASLVLKLEEEALEWVSRSAAARP